VPNGLSEKTNTNRLDRLSSVRLEMARTYRKARNSKLDLDRAKSLIWMLAQVRACIEAKVEGPSTVSGSELEPQRRSPPRIDQRAARPRCRKSGSP
jgi:hypothetical protein